MAPADRRSPGPTVLRAEVDQEIGALDPMCETDVLKVDEIAHVVPFSEQLGR